jgi:hypothetical protein
VTAQLFYAARSVAGGDEAEFILLLCKNISVCQSPICRLCRSMT